MKNFEEIFEGLTVEQRDKFETGMEMSISDFLEIMNENPLVKLIAEILLNAMLAE